MRGWDYETYWLGENLIRHFTFDSIEDYLSYLEKAEVQEAFAGGASSETGSEEFTGTTSLEHAISLARFGWHDGFNDLVRLTDDVKRAMDYTPEVNSTFHDYVGFAPDVKAYMEGSPICMINAPVVQKPHIDVYMNTSIDGFADENEVYLRGAAVLALCEVVEATGIMVDLHLFEMSFIDKDVMYSEFTVKGRDERVNLAKLHFPLCHPSWVRRLNFRLIETMPGVTQAWAGSYGIPAERKMAEEVIGIGENDVLVPTYQETHEMLKKAMGSVGVPEHSKLLMFAQEISAFFNEVLPEDKRLKFKSF